MKWTPTPTKKFTQPKQSNFWLYFKIFLVAMVGNIIGSLLFIVWFY